MTSKSAGWLFLVACVAALAAVVQDFRFDLASREATRSLASIQREASTLETKVAELRGGQTAYVATGQSPEFWMRRVTDLSAEIEAGLGRLRSDVTTPEGTTAVGSAGTALTDLLAVDKRARQAIDGDQRYLASDILFAEGLGATQTLVDSIRTASTASVAAIERQQASQALVRRAMMPAALLLVICTGALWAQSRRRETPASAAAAMAQMLRDLPPPVKPAVPAPAAPLPKPVQTVSVTDLTDAAELCVDLARLLEVADVQALISRAAGVLNASGLVIWVATESGDGLVPALSHGYSNKVLASLGVLDPASDNLTSTCFRTMRAQSMPGVGQPGATSAVAVPLVTADGCHGVLAAELAVAKPAAESVALARIIAAQLAAMTAPVAAAAESSDSATVSA